MKKEKRHEKYSLSFAVFLIIAILFFSLATILSLRDIRYCSYLDRAKSVNVVMSKIGDHINVAFAFKWNRAHSLSTRIERADVSSVDDLINVLDDIYIETGEEFKVVDDNGIAYYHDGRQEYWEDHLSVAPQAETFILSPLRLGETNENHMKYIVLLNEPLMIGEIKIIYTVLTEPLVSIQKNFNIGNFSDDCLSFIIDKSGTLICENGSNDPITDSRNFFTYVQNNIEFKYGESFEHFKEKIKSGISDTVCVKYNGSYYYLSFYDLDPEKWEAIMLVPEKNTQAETPGLSQRLLLNLVIVFATAFILLIIGFIYMWKKTVTKQRLAVEAEKRSNEAKTNFLSAMSHDIRTPMNAIVGMTEIALNCKKEIPKSVQENLENIRLSSSHLLMLVNNILDISKIESGKMSLNIAEFSIVEATNTLANLIRPLAKEKNIDLSIHTYNYSQEYLVGDELRISQVCINLATNAVKYTPVGGRIVIDFMQGFPENMPDKVCMTCVVQDTGIGMSNEFQKVMYDIFARATDSRVNKEYGSGLGLPICLKMVQMMGGTLDCQSKPGKGTTFTASVILERGKPDEVYVLPKLQILVVDHDTISTDALRRIFCRLNIEADIVNDISTLTSVLEKGQAYQVAFVELGAPGIMGIETAKIIKKHLGANTPIVFTDIADMIEYSEQIESAGVKLTMNKPYFYRTVYQIILKALNMNKTEISAEENTNERIIGEMNVLVAEDNHLNWRILCELLKINGVSADRAENGRICLDMLDAAHYMQYDAVLMDVRMPVMDGFEATQLIRSFDKEWVRKIPIIAMTADAFAEDIQHCLEAGMNSHLSKPINLDRLLSVLSEIRDGKGKNKQGTEGH